MGESRTGVTCVATFAETNGVAIWEGVHQAPLYTRRSANICVAGGVPSGQRT